MATDTRTLDDLGRDLRNRPDYERRLEAARRRARWEIGDGSWAGTILGAFLFPEADEEALGEEEST